MLIPVDQAHQLRLCLPATVGIDIELDQVARLERNLVRIAKELRFRHRPTPDLNGSFRERPRTLFDPALVKTQASLAGNAETPRVTLPRAFDMSCRPELSASHLFRRTGQRSDRI